MEIELKANCEMWRHGKHVN